VSIVAVDLGLQFIELRSFRGKNVSALTDAEIAEARKILTKYKLICMIQVVGYLIVDNGNAKRQIVEGVCNMRSFSPCQGRHGDVGRDCGGSGNKEKAIQLHGGVPREECAVLLVARYYV
jgi:hypothetical protein